MQKVTPFLWFDHEAEEAMNFYVSVFKDARVLNVNRYGKDAPKPEGTAAKQLPELLSDPDPARAGRVMQAMMGMSKIEIAALRRAAE
jgi:predicted 3-demethylubiquinone-9 3-methyltransferase (glyoxalase superfamily)